MASASTLKRYHSPETVIGRFVARRTVRSAAFVALIFGMFVAAKSEGYISAFPNLKGRAVMAASFANNIGLKALLGTPHQLETVAGFAVWNTYIVMIMIGAIWAYLTTTRLFRGEEDAGRWEIMLSGLTTARRAAANVLIGFGVSLGVLFLVTAGTFLAVGSLDKINFPVSSSLYFALATSLGAIVFAAVGAVASQLMPTRARAATLSTAVFGLFFLIRAGGDITSYHWLLYFSPLGWLELLQPFTGSQPLWLVPIIALIAVLATATVIMAGQRDLGASTIPDKDTSKPHLLLLGGPFTSALRFTRTSTISWLLGVAWLAGFFALLTKTAAQAISDSMAGNKVLDRLTHSSSQSFGAKAYLGIVFFFLMTVIMCYAASAVGAMREDEAQGYLDNLLVRTVGRIRWLGGRIVIALGVIGIACLLACVVVWFSIVALNISLTWHSIFMSGLNLVAPAVFILGLGLLTMGIAPRLTSLVTFGLIAWSFMVQMVSSGLNLNHWLLDLSIFYHVSFAPTVDPVWSTNFTLLLLGLAMGLLGAVIFNRRDLANE